MKTILDVCCTVFLFLVLTLGCSRAEMIALGTFKPKLTLFRVVVEPSVDLRADLITSTAAANVKADAVALIEPAVFVAKTREILEKQLPLQFSEGNCTLNVRQLRAYDFRIVGFTGHLDATVGVDPDGCSLTAGDVSIRLRFVLLADKDSLSVKITKVEIDIPGLWRAAGLLAGRNIRQEFADKISTTAKDNSLKMPKIEGGRAAFQGASLDMSGGSMAFRLRADLQIDQTKLVKMLADIDQVRTLSFSYP